MTPSVADPGVTHPSDATAEDVAMWMIGWYRVLYRCCLTTRITVKSNFAVIAYRLLNINKMLRYRRETAQQGALVLAKSGRMELGDNNLRTL